MFNNNSKDYDELQEKFEFVLDRLHPQNFVKQYKKENRINLLHMYGNVIYKWVIERGHRRRQEMETLIERLSEPKVASALSTLIDEYNKSDFFDEEETKVGIEFVVVINEVLNKLDPKEELYLDYYTIAMSLIEKRMFKMVKRTNISEALAKNLLFAVPKPEIVPNDHVVGIFVNKAVRRMYSYANTGQEGLPTDIEQLHKVFEFLFGKYRMDEVIVSLALERRQAHNSKSENFNAINSLISNLVVEYLNESKKSDIKDMLLRFADRRINDRKQKRDAARRLQINTLAKDDYKKIIKVADKIKKDPRLVDIF